jgi:hypothetical protein
MFVHINIIYDNTLRVAYQASLQRSLIRTWGWISRELCRAGSGLSRNEAEGSHSKVVAAADQTLVVDHQDVALGGWVLVASADSDRIFSTG